VIPFGLVPASFPGFSLTVSWKSHGRPSISSRWSSPWLFILIGGSSLSSLVEGSYILWEKRDIEGRKERAALGSEECQRDPDISCKGSSLTDQRCVSVVCHQVGPNRAVPVLLSEIDSHTAETT